MSDLKIVSAEEILATEYPPLRWAVKDIMPEGFALMAGRPKIGKSWLALNMAVSVLHGTPFLGKFATEQGRILYGAFEDGERRIKRRLRALGLEAIPRGLDFLFQMPRIDQGGLEALAEWFDEQKEEQDVRLCVIDVLSKIRSPKAKGADSYQHDVDQAGKIQKLAMEFAIPTLVTHHDRKAVADDWLDQISGTLGLAGSADAVMLLTRDRSSALGRLRITGRDLEVEPDLGLEFKDGIWSFVGEGEIGDLRSPDRQRIVLALPEKEPGLSPTAIAEKTGIDPETIKKALKNLAALGLIRKTSYGEYVR
jgi:RecA-family ATPase